MHDFRLQTFATKIQSKLTPGTWQLVCTDDQLYQIPVNYGAPTRFAACRAGSNPLQLSNKCRIMIFRPDIKLN
jgi:hypothetical protein